jgi:hypothetical protein
MAAKLLPPNTNFLEETVLLPTGAIICLFYQ